MEDEDEPQLLNHAMHEPKKLTTGESSNNDSYESSLQEYNVGDNNPNALHRPMYNLGLHQ